MIFHLISFHQSLLYQENLVAQKLVKDENLASLASRNSLNSHSSEAHAVRSQSVSMLIVSFMPKACARIAIMLTDVKNQQMLVHTVIGQSTPMVSAKTVTFPSITESGVHIASFSPLSRSKMEVTVQLL